MVGKMSLDLLNLETLKFLTHFKEPGSSLVGVSENSDGIPEHERKYSRHVQVQ
jgi:hypothetical protein